MAAGFHVNPKGDAGKCTAEEGNCPFGGSDRHYPTEAVARQAFELSMAGGAFPKLNPETTANVQGIMAHKEILTDVEADIQKRLHPGENFQPGPEKMAVLYDAKGFLKKLAHSPTLTTRGNRERLIDGLKNFQDEALIRANRAKDPSRSGPFHNNVAEAQAWKEVEYAFHNARIKTIAAGDMPLRDAENYATRELTQAIQNSPLKGNYDKIMVEESGFLDKFTKGSDELKDSSDQASVEKELREKFVFNLMARRDQALERVADIEEHEQPGNETSREREIKVAQGDIAHAYTRTLNAMGAIDD